jgi:glycosyltransferase involved in cell wall biosynthesis
MTRAFPLVRPGVLKVVDTIDVFSTKSNKVEKFGIEDGCAITPEEEAKLLDQANLVIAIQPEEASELRRLAPNKRIITAGVDFDSIDFIPAAARHPIILLVGSDNQLNVKGLKDFLRFAWQLICREVPDAELRIVGAVGSQVEIDDPSVKVLGRIDNLDAAYAEARVVINPAVAGTGLKIKTVQALCHLRPVVAWPSGVEGIEAELQGLCYVATNWYSFARHVINLCNKEDGAYPLLKKRDEIRQAFSADTIYKELDVALGALPGESMQSSLGSIEVFPNN